MILNHKKKGYYNIPRCAKRGRPLRKTARKVNHIAWTCWSFLCVKLNIGTPCILLSWIANWRSLQAAIQASQLQAILCWSVQVYVDWTCCRCGMLICLSVLSLFAMPRFSLRIYHHGVSMFLTYCSAVCMVLTVCLSVCLPSVCLLVLFSVCLSVCPLFICHAWWHWFMFLSYRFWKAKEW